LKLYVTAPSNNKKNLDVYAESRPELQSLIGSEYLSVEGITYHVSQVFAEKGQESAPASAVIGGAIGLVGGMPGVLIGGAIGALFGNEADKKEELKIQAFNRS